MRLNGWPGFVLWALLGIVYALGGLAMMSIGIYIIVLATILTIVASRTLQVWPEIIGLAIGPAAAMLWIARRAWDLPRCGPGEQPGVSVSASSSLITEPGNYSEVVQFGCTALDVRSLLWTGIAIGGATLIAYIAARSRRLTTS